MNFEDHKDIQVIEHKGKQHHAFMVDEIIVKGPTFFGLWKLKFAIIKMCWQRRRFLKSTGIKGRKHLIGVASELLGAVVHLQLWECLD